MAYPTLCECYSLVLYKLGASVAQGWLGEIESSSFLMNPTPDDFREAAGLMHRYGDQALSMFDAVAAAVSRRLSLPVWTYDHHFDVVLIEVWHKRVALRRRTSVEIGRSDSRVFPG